MLRGGFKKLPLRLRKKGTALYWKKENPIHETVQVE
jgi:hypothetical protein